MSENFRGDFFDSHCTHHHPCGINGRNKELYLRHCSGCILSLWIGETATATRSWAHLCVNPRRLRYTDRKNPSSRFCCRRHEKRKELKRSQSQK